MERMFRFLSFSAIDGLGLNRALRPGGRIDLHKASEVLLHDFRAGRIGQLSLETPAMAEIEKAEVAKMLAEKEAKEEAKREQERLKRSGKRLS